MDKKIIVSPFFKETPESISAKIKALSVEDKSELAASIGASPDTGGNDPVTAEDIRALGFDTSTEVDAKIAAIPGPEPSTELSLTSPDGSVFDLTISNSGLISATRRGGEVVFTKIVGITASIGEQSFGTASVTETNTVMNQLSLDRGVNVEWYFNSISGSRLADAPRLIREARAAHPGNDVLFIVSLGGGDISYLRPFSTMTTAEADNFVAGLDAIEQEFSDIPSQFFIEPPTFRNYNGTTFEDETMGSLPFVQNYYLSRLPAKYTNTDGNSIMDQYNKTRNAYDTFLEADHVHPSAAGEEFYRNMWADASDYLINGGVKPAPVVRRGQPTGVGPEDIIISVGQAVGENSIVTLTVPDQYFSLKRSNGDIVGNIGGDGDLRLKIIKTGAYNQNSNGADFGAEVFDNTLSNNNIYNTSLFTGGSTVTHVFSGLVAGQSYVISACGSRVAADDRYTELTDGNVSIVYKTSGSNTPVAPVSQSFTADANGQISITQKPQDGQTGNAAAYSYLGGLSISI